jgi:hypothetical protein
MGGLEKARSASISKKDRFKRGTSLQKSGTTLISEDHRLVEKPNEDMSCTIIVCTRDRPEQLDRCLEAVSAITLSEIQRARGR